MLRTFIFLLLLSIPLQAATLGEYLKDYLRQGEGWSATPVVAADGTYQLISISGAYSLIFAEEPGGYRLVTNPATIYAVLGIAGRATNGTPSDAALAAVRENVVTFNSSRSAEAECARLTGTDIVPCYDRDSCLRACIRSPICRGYVFGAGANLLAAMADFSTGTSSLDGSVVALLASTRALSASSPEETLRTANRSRGDFEAAERTATSLLANQLFNTSSLDFCPRPFYDLSALRAGRSAMGEIAESALLAVDQPAIAAQVITRTAERRQLAQDRQYCAAESARVDSETGALVNSTKEISGKFPELASALFRLRAASNQLALACQRDDFSSFKNSLADYSGPGASDDRQAVSNFTSAWTEAQRLLAANDAALFTAVWLSDQNRTSLSASQAQVRKELGLISTYSDLVTLLNVLKENEKELRPPMFGLPALPVTLELLFLGGGAIVVAVAGLAAVVWYLSRAAKPPPKPSGTGKRG